MKRKPIIAHSLISAVFLAALAAAAADAPTSPCDPFAGRPCGFSEVVPVAPAAETYPPDIWVRADRIYYLWPWQVDMSQMPPIPAAGSAADKEDLDTVRRWQTERTAAQCAAAEAQADSSYDAFFREVSPFAAPLPKEVEKILQKVSTDDGSVIFVAKARFRRPRPFQRDPAITPCISKPGGYSYPSGHTTSARVFGLILSDLVPAEAGKFMFYADQAALNRVIAGVHHPSDIAAGKKLGDAVYKALKKSGSFKKDMETLRRNLRP